MSVDLVPFSLPASYGRLALQYVQESVHARRDRLLELAVRLHLEVDVVGGCPCLNGGGDAEGLAGDDDGGYTVLRRTRNLIRVQLLIMTQNTMAKKGTREGKRRYRGNRFG